MNDIRQRKIKAPPSDKRAMHCKLAYGRSDEQIHEIAASLDGYPEEYAEDRERILYEWYKAGGD